jgi:hypothetical protein
MGAEAEMGARLEAEMEERLEAEMGERLARLGQGPGPVQQQPRHLPTANEPVVFQHNAQRHLQCDSDATESRLFGKHASTVRGLRVNH